MAKPRSDSLYERLGREGILDDFFIWVYANRPGYKEIAEWLDKADMPNSDGAIHTLTRVHSIYWKVDAAERKAAASAEALPENTDGLIRRLLQKKEFELAYAELGTKESLAVLKFDQDKQTAEFNAKLELAKLELKKDAEKRAKANLKLAREKFEAAERRAALADQAEEVTSATDLTPEEKDRKLKVIFGLA